MGLVLWSNGLILPLQAAASCIGSGSCSACSTSDHLLAYVMGKQWRSGGWPKSLGPCTYMGDLKETPDIWLQANAVSIVETIWEGTGDGRYFSL